MNIVQKLWVLNRFYYILLLPETLHCHNSATTFCYLYLACLVCFWGVGYGCQMCHCYRIDCTSRTWRFNTAYNRACQWAHPWGIYYLQPSSLLPKIYLILLSPSFCIKWTVLEKFVHQNLCAPCLPILVTCPAFCCVLYLTSTFFHFT